MDFSLELGKEMLQRIPDVLRAMLTDLSDQWTGTDEAEQYGEAVGPWRELLPIIDAR